MQVAKTQRTVKAFESDISTINEQAKNWGCSAAEVIHVFCESIRKQRYLHDIGEAFDLLISNANQISDFESQQSTWDIVTLEGLHNANQR